MAWFIAGFNPFGHYSRSFLIWPVFLTMHNLPTSMCKKRAFIFLNLVVPSPKGPRKRMDFFFRPMIDKLKVVWDDGVCTYDISKQQNFQMRAALSWTINDFLTYGMLLEWSTHRRLTCPYYMEHTWSFVPKEGRQTSIFDCHRQFLLVDHPFQKNKEKFIESE